MTISHPNGTSARDPRPALITGGAGFIGTNLAARLLADGRHVMLLDNLARPGVERNVAYLRERYGERVQLLRADIRDRAALGSAVRAAGQVFHFAAQVAVTTSLHAPLDDFEINAAGTLYLLEALRALDAPPPLVFTSTNKVYGGLPDVELRSNDLRYEPVDETIRAHGISEHRPLDFHSPYGCSKGAADQYVVDYARTFGLPAVVFRMSCIYGPHQCGTEDQGWVAHCLISALERRTITIFGDGKQVRDVLYVGDLVDALLAAQAHMRQISGRAFNIGGGAASTLSLLELIEHIRTLDGARPHLRFAGWRPGDQRFYVSDTAAFTRATGWQPRTSVQAGVAKLYGWLRETRPQLAHALGEVRQ